jgi:steroid delta-isomerase-like uncharacterized protein
MSEQENIRIVEKWVEALNAHEVSRLVDYRAAAYSFEVPDLPGSVGVDEETAWTIQLFDRFPDFHIDVAETIAQGDYVVINFTVSGTNEGALQMPTGETVPPTGRKVVAAGSNTLQFKDGKVARNSIYYDQLGVLAQLGLMPGV